MLQLTCPFLWDPSPDGYPLTWPRPTLTAESHTAPRPPSHSSLLSRLSVAWLAWELLEGVSVSDRVLGRGPWGTVNAS